MQLLSTKMNSYQLISKLKKIRGDTYLTAIDQALYYELISVCNDKGWKDVFDVRSNSLCSSLNIWDKTLRKSRKALADAGLISFESGKDKRVGCYYSFTKKLSNDMKTSVISSVPATDEKTEEKTDDTPIIEPISSVRSTEEITVPITDEEKNTSVISSVPATDDTATPPYKGIQTINKESLAHTHEPPPPKKQKSSRKKEGDEKPLVYPFTSLQFMTVWEALRNTPKWKKKLNYALQLSLNKLGQFEEAFAIEQMERAIESNWVGVVFPETDKLYQEWLNRKNGKSISTTKSANSSSTANERKESVEGLASLAEGVLQRIGAEKFK